MKKTFFFLAALAMSAMMWAETASVELCTNWNKELDYGIAYTQDYTIDDLNGGETTMTLAVKGVYRNGTKNTYFQMNKKEGYFKNTTALPGKITKIETTWSAAKGPKKCYFATDDEASASDAVVEVSSATSVTYTPDDEQEYYYFNIDVKTGSASAQMTSCVVYYEPGTPSSVTLDSLVIKGVAEKMEYEVGEAFDPAGLEVWGIYTKVMKHDSTSQIKKGITWTIDPETFENVSDNESVTLVASYKELTTADTTITGVNVIPAVKRIETTIAFSNTLFGVKEVGNNAKEQSVTKDTVTIVSGCKSTASTKTNYQADHVRYYTDSYLKLSAPNGLAITEIVFKEKDTWNSDGLSANVGTYDAATKTWTGKNRSIEFSFSKQCRVGSIKVTCVETAPAAENPTITADTVADFYWEPITVTLACVTEGADIYYTLDGSEPTASATKYDAPFSVTATTTVKAIAIKSGLDNSEVASKIFNFGKVFDNIAACFADSTLQNGDVVKISNVSAVITSFAGSGKTVYFEGGSFYVNATYPEAYAIGGTLSGSNLQFTYMNYDPQQLRPASWDAFTYTAPASTALPEVMLQNNFKKVMHNGQMMIIRDNQLFDLQGNLIAE